jgi:hypothetical protein
MQCLDGLAGTHKWSFFNFPSPDSKKAAYEQTVAFSPNWWKPYATASILLFSPNTIWLAIAIVAHFAFPLERQSISWSWMLSRALFNSFLVLVFFGFWHAGSKKKKKKKKKKRKSDWSQLCTFGIGVSDRFKQRECIVLQSCFTMFFIRFVALSCGPRLRLELRSAFKRID